MLLDLRSDPRTLIVPIFLQLLLHSLSVKCTLKKGDLFQIWGSPLEIGFTPAHDSHFQLCSTFSKLIFLWKGERWIQPKDVRLKEWQVTDIPDKTKQGNLKDGPWLSLPQNTNAIQCCKVALIGSRSIRWKILRHFQRGREGGRLARWARATINIASGPTHHFSFKTNPPFRCWIIKHCEKEDFTHNSRQEFLNIWNNLKARKRKCIIQQFQYLPVFTTEFSNTSLPSFSRKGQRVHLLTFFRWRSYFGFSLEIEMFSPQNLLDFVGFMQMTCWSGGSCGD